MTIGTTISSITDQGNSVTTAFAYPFLIPAASDANVLYTAANGEQTVISALSYGISGIGNATGGVVTYPTSGSPLASGTTLTISRILPLIQSVSISAQGPTFAAIESALDYLTMLVQQVNGLADRAIVVNPADPIGALPLPVASARANNYLFFDSEGNPTAAQAVGGSAVISVPMQPVVAASSVALAAVLMNVLALTGGTMTGGLVIEAGGLTIGSGSVLFGGNSVSGSNFTITGGTISNTPITGSTVAGTNAGFSGNLNVAGTSTFMGDAMANGNFGVAGAGEFETTLGVTGMATLSGGAVVFGSFSTDATPASFGGDLTVHGALMITGATSATISGWQLAPGGTSAFSGTANIAVNASGNSMLCSQYIASSDARIKTQARDITPEEGVRFVREVPARMYRKDGNWEAGFYAQDIVKAGFHEIVMMSDDETMMALMNGHVGPCGKRLELIHGTPQAYLAAALSAALDKIERLEAAMGVS